MNKFKFLLSAWLIFTAVFARADEGMWLLQLMKEQHAIDMMKERGLKLTAEDIYNPDGTSLKDAVGIFGRGCTGEIISPEGLILTNHHCGYSFIQQHSSVENDYLTDGFWAYTRKDELPTPNLEFTFVERIEDITDIVNDKIAKGEVAEAESLTSTFLNKLARELHKAGDLNDRKGITPQALPFYAGNKFYLIYKKTYTDVRMVAAPPSGVGKFGGETDNWMWPRHTGDFSMFRVYADGDGEPAAYSPENTPLKTEKFLTISIKGLEEGDYAMILGFPGRTNRYLTASEVLSRMEAANAPRIRIRGERQQVLKAEMNRSDKIRIQYANKYASSSNYWKNSIGMNKAIVDNGVLEIKAEQEEKFLQFAKSRNDAGYLTVVDSIDDTVRKLQPLTYQLTCLSEAFSTGLEFRVAEDSFIKYAEAFEQNDSAATDKQKAELERIYNRIFDKDFDMEVDRKVAKVLVPLYAAMVAPEDRISIYAYIDDTYKGDYNAFVDDVYDNSILSNKSSFDKFLDNPTRDAINKDPQIRYSESVGKKFTELVNITREYSKKLDLLHKTYIRGLNEMNEPTPSYPDANFTIRLTYGNVKSYNPKDGVHYKYYTTTGGILEKEDPDNREFNVPSKLKELILDGDYGRYALPDGKMPVCFLTNNDITGGNSGSPVLNAKGELIGCAFDGNWESLSGDLVFDNDMQRCINVDIRYVLFIIEKLGNCQHLINEMRIVE